MLLLGQFNLSVITSSHDGSALSEKNDRIIIIIISLIFITISSGGNIIDGGSSI